ncbi:hypothetical protein [Billgrantia pellis]|uniref:hypothetical protein n=1 Tax=Billgrantia pellis TaxID=2606936 RepID=UPI0016594C72|nr:hypothetical protein [Halomonas pellis]
MIRKRAPGMVLSTAGRHLPCVTEELVAGRRRDRPHGPVAKRLWQFLETQALALRRDIEAGDYRPPVTSSSAPLE